jgi:DNA replication protein DnaC
VVWIGDKSQLGACALGQYACRRGHSVNYLRTPRLAEELRVLHGTGSFGKCLLQLAKTDVLTLDDWVLASLDAATRADLFEVIDDRTGSWGTIITSQLPVEHWHSRIWDFRCHAGSAATACRPDHPQRGIAASAQGKASRGPGSNLGSGARF